MRCGNAEARPFLYVIISGAPWLFLFLYVIISEAPRLCLFLYVIISGTLRRGPFLYMIISGAPWLFLFLYILYIVYRKLCPAAAGIWILPKIMTGAAPDVRRAVCNLQTNQLIGAAPDAGARPPPTRNVLWEAF